MAANAYPPERGIAERISLGMEGPQEMIDQKDLYIDLAEAYLDESGDIGDIINELDDQELQKLRQFIINLVWALQDNSFYEGLNYYPDETEWLDEDWERRLF